MLGCCQAELQLQEGVEVCRATPGCLLLLCRRRRQHSSSGCGGGSRRHQAANQRDQHIVEACREAHQPAKVYCEQPHFCNLAHESRQQVVEGTRMQLNAAAPQLVHHSRTAACESIVHVLHVCANMLTKTPQLWLDAMTASYEFVAQTGSSA